MPSRSISTILVGPSDLRRECFSRVLDSTDFRVVASEAHLRDVELTSFADHRFVLLIVDSSNDIRSAVEQIRQFKVDFPAGRVALLADRLVLEDVAFAFRVGANAYFSHAHTCDALIKALEMVMLGETIVPPELLTRVCKNAEESAADLFGAGSADNHADASGPDAGPRLSEREKYILRCIVGGASNKHIARKLNITEATVKTHVRAILSKIRVQNRTQAAIWAVSNSSDLWTMKDDVAPPLAPKPPATETSVDLSPMRKVWRRPIAR